MNKLKPITALICLFTALFFSSCETEPIDPAVLENIDNPGTTSGVFKVDFNGQTYEATNTSAIIADGFILIGGSRGTNGENIGIVLEGTAIGSYTDNALISYNPNEASEYDYANLNEEFITNGSVIITEINTITKVITGTFSYIGYWSDYTDDAPPAPISFTNGSFSIPYTIGIPNPDPDPLEGSFTVDIDGTPFVANSIIAVKSVALDPITNEPIINPETNLPFITYSIAGKFNETKIVTVQFIERLSNSYNIPEDGGALITYVPNALNAMEMYSGINLESDENIGNITVLANNPTTQIISGTFNCKVSLIDFNTGEVTAVKQLTNGIFEDIPYINQ